LPASIGENFNLWCKFNNLSPEIIKFEPQFIKFAPQIKEFFSTLRFFLHGAQQNFPWCATKLSLMFSKTFLDAQQDKTNAAEMTLCSCTGFSVEAGGKTS